MSYSFDIITNDGTRAEIDLKEGILPNRFFELFKTVRKVPNSTEEEKELNKYKQEFDQLKRTLAAQIVDKPLSELFIVRVVAPVDAN